MKIEKKRKTPVWLDMFLFLYYNMITYIKGVHEVKKIGNVCKSIGFALAFYLVAYCFAFFAHARGYYIRLAHFEKLSTFDLWDKISTGAMIVSAIYIVLWFVLAFWAGRKKYHCLFAGMMIFTVTALASLLGFFFIGKVDGLAVLPAFLAFPWSAPMQALFVASGTMQAFQTAFYSMMGVMPVGAIGCYIFGKNLQ